MTDSTIQPLPMARLSIEGQFVIPQQVTDIARGFSRQLKRLLDLQDPELIQKTSVLIIEALRDLHELASQDSSLAKDPQDLRDQAREKYNEVIEQISRLMKDLTSGTITAPTFQPTDLDSFFRDYYLLQVLHYEGCKENAGEATLSNWRASESGEAGCPTLEEQDREIYRLLEMAVLAPNRTDRPQDTFGFLYPLQLQGRFSAFARFQDSISPAFRFSVALQARFGHWRQFVVRAGISQYLSFSQDENEDQLAAPLSLKEGLQFNLAGGIGFSKLGLDILLDTHFAQRETIIMDAGGVESSQKSIDVDIALACSYKGLGLTLGWGEGAIYAGFTFGYGIPLPLPPSLR